MKCFLFQVTICIVAIVCGSSFALAADATTVDCPLLAHWTFDETDEDKATKIVDQVSGQPNVAPEYNGRRCKGVFGRALDLDGAHRLRTAPTMLPENLEAISFSAWIMPAEISNYREIFRQECARRLLFSLQHNGTILSMGLSVNGKYAECDAQIDVPNVWNGRWRHCVTTFDGHRMRVFLDGMEIRAMRREGKLDIDHQAPCFIGSLGGGSEHFQGGIDDLRIYGAALSLDQVRSLYQEGARRLEVHYKELEKQLAEVYQRHSTLVDTLDSTASMIHASKLAVAGQLRTALVAKLRADFPKEYDAYRRIVGADPLAILSDSDDQETETIAGMNREKLKETVEHLTQQLIEYRPLTDEQWSILSESQAKYWRQTEQIVVRLGQTSAAATSKPDKIDPYFRQQLLGLLVAAAARVDDRPYQREAVAPYRKPSTPETRDLSTDEADAALKRDWLFQADGRPSKQRIETEIGWTRSMVERITKDNPRCNFDKDLAELDTVAARVAKISGDDAELYYQVRRIKRRIMLSDPVVDFSRVLMVDMPYPAGNEWRHETRHRLGYMAVPGGRLLVLDGLSPAGHLRQLAPQKPLHGSFWRPDISRDGTRVVYSFKPHNEKAFHLYEIGIDGTGNRQITAGRFDDLDPIYLPDGKHIAFSTTRGYTYVRCMPPTNAYVLARINRDGSDLYLISRNNEPDYLPSVLNDGRIIYTRWEYTDKPLWRAQGLWVMNPDGTNVNTFWGNQSVWPDLLKDARSIPGSRRVMFTGSAHHNWFSGSVGILDPDNGYNFPDGLTKVTADLAWPESGNGPTDPIESERYHASGRYTAYYSPYPLSEKVFLTSAERGGKFVLLLMDTDGNRELIYEGVNNIFHAIPVRAQKPVRVIPDRVQWPSLADRDRPAKGVIYSSDVYQGSSIPRGKAKYLRVMNIEPKTYTYWDRRPYISTGPVVSMVQSDGVKRVVGTVPIEADGSVSFRAPAGRALHFQLLDENYRCLQTMRSFTGVMPGESRGCTGCHELQKSTPDTASGSGIALRQPPRDITPPPWDDTSVSYARYVRPVLDKYCSRCHEGDGKGRQRFDMTERPGFRMFNEPYVTLIGRPSWGKKYQPPAVPPPGFGIADMLYVEGYDQRDPAGYATPPPMTALSYKSRLIDIASSGKHNDVRVDPVSLRRLIVWIDAMCPYRGAEEVRAIDDPSFQGVDWLSIRPRIKSAPTVVRPGPLSATDDDPMYEEKVGSRQ